MAGGWGAVGSESEGWTGLDGEGEAQGGLRMMPWETGERPPPGNLAETSCTGKAPALYTPRLLFLSPASLLSLQPLPTAASASARSRGSRRGLKSECDFHENPIIKFEWKVNPLRFHSLASGWNTWLTLILRVNE